MTSHEGVRSRRKRVAVIYQPINIYTAIYVIYAIRSYILIFFLEDRTFLKLTEMWWVLQRHHTELIISFVVRPLKQPMLLACRQLSCQHERRHDRQVWEPKPAQLLLITSPIAFHGVVMFYNVVMVVQGWSL